MAFGLLVMTVGGVVTTAPDAMSAPHPVCDICGDPARSRYRSGRSAPLAAKTRLSESDPIADIAHAAELRPKLDTHTLHAG